MGQEYTQRELKKILNDEGFAYPMNLAMASAWLLGNLKGINLRVFDTQKMSSLADYFILGSATNTTQLQSMSDSILTELKALGFEVRSVEGLAGADWVLIDLGDVIVHIFLDSSRSVYDLENLWAEATNIPIPNEYYSSSDDETNTSTSGGDKDYF